MYFLIACTWLVLSVLLAPAAGIAQHRHLTLSSGAMSAEGESTASILTTLANTGMTVTLGVVYDPSCHPQHADPAVVRHFDTLDPSIATFAICHVVECGHLVSTPAIQKLNISIKEHRHGPTTQD